MARASTPSSDRTRGSAASAPVELAVADVDGDRRVLAPRMQQHVGEAAGRGADVEAGEPGGIEREGVERGGELEAAARDVRVGRLGFDRGGLVDLLGGLAHHAPPILTSPAAIAACARARLGKKPRSTRTMSARLRMETLKAKEATGCSTGQCGPPSAVRVQLGGAKLRRMSTVLGVFHHKEHEVCSKDTGALCASFVFIVVDSFDPLAGPGMSA